MASLLNGIPQETLKGSGGLYTVYITELENVPQSGVTITAGVVKINTLAGVWKKYVLAKEAGSNFTSVYTSNVQNGTSSYVNTLTMIFRRNQVSKRNELKVLANSPLVAIVLDNITTTLTGDCSISTSYFIGAPVCLSQGGADVSTATIATGAAMTDANSMTIVITSTETIVPPSLSDADIAKLKLGQAITNP
jgi:hypothetical protein